MDSRRSTNHATPASELNTDLRSYAFLDAKCEAALQELAQLAARTTGMPFAAITLGEPTRLWFKAACGFDAQLVSAGIELCRTVVGQRAPLHVADATRWPEFATSAGVQTYPHLRAFAGIPLQNGHVHPIGSLFVGDTQAGSLTDDQQDVLRILARQVVTQLELARRMNEVHRAEQTCVLAESRLRHQHRLLQLQQQIAVAANEATSAVTALQTGLELVCAHTGWPVGHCYVIDYQRRSELVTLGAWHLRDPERFANFRRVTEALRYAAGCGISGEVLRTGAALCVENLGTEEQFRRADIAREAGLRYGHFIPLKYGGATVGILEFFSEFPAAAHEDLGAVLNYVGLQFGQVIGRDRTNHVMRESERRLRDLFESSPDAIFVEDGNGNVLDVNPAACALHETTRDWLIGKNVLDLVPPAHREAVRKDFARLARLELDYVEGESLTQTGRIVPVEIRANRVEYAGQPALLLHVRSVSDRKQLQQQFLQAQRTEAIGQLAGGVAHDFNNILTVITGYSELLLMRAELPAGVRHRLREIEQAGFRGANLTRQLLAFSRKQVLQPHVLDLNTVVADIEKMLRRLIGENIELVTYLQAGLGHIKADPSQLEQVLMNLAVNARDAMPDGGSLVIGTADVELTAAAAWRIGNLPAGRYVVLSVTDTGCGMPPAIIGRIFEPFFTTKPAGKGTGLGLATCYGIVKQSGGHIIVESTPGQGTKFRIYLPRVTEAATPIVVHALPEDAELRGTETILLVEDETTVRLLAAETLRGYGYTVLEAGNGEEALVLAQTTPRQPFDLLLTDVVMPQVSGPELAKLFQKTYPGARVLFTSGYTNDNTVIQNILQQGVGFLEKPYTGTALARKIREVLGSSGNNRSDNHGQDPDRR
ncbi:MAG: Sensor histidine kinase RcsC [Verrucomicrobiae bacterium]|nr:Sensor histidine kinase RcsC [Verrucomicrobiae bacterium]